MFIALRHLKLFARLGCNARFAVALQEVEVFHERVDWQVLSLADVLLLDSSLTFFQLTFALSNAFVFKLKVDPHLLSIESLHLLAALFCVWQEEAGEFKHANAFFSSASLDRVHHHFVDIGVYLLLRRVVSALPLFSLRAARTVRLVVIVLFKQLYIKISLDAANILSRLLIKLVVCFSHHQLIDVDFRLVVRLTWRLKLVSVEAHTTAV